ncbi:MAG: hypothetical protein DHS80DRAFT_22427 [Piptocephalis tieghemiana]|nr:MAG: hypothetical protein DHS80DRAFT_22427 [Piptocephalis tieghemiana]
MFDDLNRSEPNRPTLAPKPQSTEALKDRELEEKRTLLKRRRGPRGSFLDRVDERLARLENMLHSYVHLEEEEGIEEERQRERKKYRSTSSRKQQRGKHLHPQSNPALSHPPIPKSSSSSPEPCSSTPSHQMPHEPSIGHLPFPPPPPPYPDVWKQGIHDLPDQKFFIQCVHDDLLQEDMKFYIHYQSLLNRAIPGSLPPHLVFSYMCMQGVRKKALIPAEQAAHYRSRAMSFLQDPELSLDVVLSLMYLTIFCFSRMETSTASILLSSSIRISQELGLHVLDSPQTERPVPQTPEDYLHLEQCRRLWWVQQTIDSFACLSLGRPRSIDTRDMCLRFPGDDVAWTSLTPIIPSYVAPLFDATEFEQTLLDLPAWTNPLHGLPQPSFYRVSNPAYPIYFPSSEASWCTWAYRSALLSLISGRIGHLVHGRSPRKAPPPTSPHSELSLLRRALWAIHSTFPHRLFAYSQMGRISLSVYILYYSLLMVLNRACLRVHPATGHLEATTSMAMRALQESRAAAHEVILLNAHRTNPRGHPMPFLVFCAYLAGDIHLDRVWDTKASESDRLQARTDFTTCLWIIRESGINWDIAHQYLMNLMGQMKKRLAGPTPAETNHHNKSHSSPVSSSSSSSSSSFTEPLGTKEKVSPPFSSSFPIASRTTPSTPSSSSHKNTMKDKKA